MYSKLRGEEDLLISAFFPICYFSVVVDFFFSFSVLSNEAISLLINV